MLSVEASAAGWVQTVTAGGFSCMTHTLIFIFICMYETADGVVYTNKALRSPAGAR